jgi:phage FluMu protein Com
MNKKLDIIPKPKPDSVTLLLPKKGERLPLIKFDGDSNLLCGNCNEILVEGLIEDEGQIMNVVIRCPICRSYNEVNIHSSKSNTYNLKKNKNYNSTLFY